VYPLTLGLVISTKELWDEVQAAVRDLPVRILFEQPEIADREGFRDKLERMRPNVVLLDITNPREPVPEMIQKACASTAPPVVIALHMGKEPEIILEAIRAGAKEFLYPPLAGGLERALERISSEFVERDPSRRTGGKILGFLSAKGGCGATTIACHTAVELQRQTGGKVLLADLDMAVGMIGFLMKAKGTYTIADALHNVHRLDWSYWRALVSNGTPGVEVLPAPKSASLHNALAWEQVRPVLRFTQSHYDWVVADLGRSLGRFSMAAVEELHELFLVTTLDVPALHQAKNIAQTLLDSGYASNKIHMVLNRMPKHPEVTSAELEKMLGLPLRTIIPNDYPALYEAYAEGKLLSPTTRLGKHMAGFATKIAGLHEPPKKKYTLFG